MIYMVVLNEIFVHLLHICVHIQQCNVSFLYAHFVDQTSTHGLSSPLKQLEIAPRCLMRGVVARYISINVIFFCKLCAHIVRDLLEIECLGNASLHSCFISDGCFKPL
jgi:hypothetical protein